MSEGIAGLERAVALDPRDVESWHRLAVAFFDANRFDEAERCCHRVLDIEPRHARALANLGAILQRRGADEEAARHYRASIAADPALAPPRFSLAVLLLAAGRRDEAIEEMRRAVALDPGRAEWHAILGEACCDAGRLRDARSSLETALRLAPDMADAHDHLGTCLLESGDSAGAVAHYRRALELAPGQGTAASNLLFALNYVSDAAPEAIFAEHAAWGKRVSHGTTRPAHANGRDPERRLRIGYVSPDFREHALAYFIEPVLSRHDRSRFEAVCYSDAVREDRVTERLRRHAALWRATGNLDTDALVQKIRDDRVDILVDLAGHSMGGKRMPVFAQKPAPLQASWLGYLNTTGLPTIDYRITDTLACPQGWERFHTEQLLRMPDSQWCFAAVPDAPAVGAPPADRGFVTFGSLHNLAKLSLPVIALWSRLLRQVAGSRLLLLAPGGEQTSTQLAAQFAAQGIDATRLEFTDRLPIAGYLEMHNRIDVNLDAFPYTGGTTTCHSLWMGVPVVTLRGDTVVSRGGASLLNAVGLSEFVAENESQYLDIAVQIARDAKRLALLRSGLRQRIAQSPLMDAARFTAQLESAYRGIWRRWCADAPAGGRI